MFVENTHVSILLLYISQRCGCEIYFRKGTKSSKKRILYHSISSLCQYLETSACDVLPAFQALTGCDYTYQFYRRSKYGKIKIMLRKRKCSISFSFDLY